jgi:elongation factor Ts
MEVNATLVKELREKTGAGMMDCKKALAETAGNLEKAVDYLRQKGLAAAAKKADRVATDGAVGAYVHPGGKIGVLVEINCETDFVARTNEFQSLLKDIAMQVAAANPRFVRREEVSAEELQREQSIYRQQALESGNRKRSSTRSSKENGRFTRRLVFWNSLYQGPGPKGFGYRQ